MSNKKHAILISIKTPYIALIVITLLLGTLTVFITSRMTLDEMNDSNERNLDTSMMLIEDAFDAAFDFMNDIVQSAQLNKLLTSDIDNYTLRNIAHSIPALRTTYEIVDRYFLYYAPRSSEERGFALAPHMPYLNLSHYYDSCFRYENMLENEFWEMVRSTKTRMIYPASDTVYLSKSSRSVLMVHPYDNHDRLYFMIYFDVNRIIHLFNSICGPYVKWVGMYDNNGTLLLSSDSEDLHVTLPSSDALNEDRGHVSVTGTYTLQYARSNTSGRMYAVLLDNTMFTERIVTTLFAMYACVVLLLTTAAFVIWLINQNSHKPLKQMVSLLPIDYSEAGFGLWPVKTAVENLLRDHHQLSNQLEIRNTQMRDAAIAQLIKGNFEDEEEMNEILLHTGLVIMPSEEYRGVYLQVHSKKEPSEVSLPHLSIRHAVLSKAIESFAPDLQMLTLKEENIYILLYTRMVESPSMTEILNRIYTVLRDVVGADISLYVGIPCRTLKTLHQSFTSAKPLIHGDIAGEKFLSIAEVRPMSVSFDYTSQDESSLIIAARRNEPEKIDELLKAIYQRNFEKQQNLSFFNQQSLFSAMIHTLSRTECPEPLPSELMNIPIRMNGKEFFESIRLQYIAIGTWHTNHRRAEKNLMLNNVLEFIHENYSNPDMSLSFTALRFGLTEPYLSEVFKKRIEMNFSTYVEQLRIKKAQELLRTTQLTIQQISEDVGYSNVRTFRRAYSRVRGCSPTDERQLS